MSPDADLVHVDEGMAPRKLLDGRLLVGETIIAQIPVAVVVIPLRSLRVAAAIPDLDHDEPELRQRLAIASRIERLGHAFGLRSRVDVQNNRVFLERIEMDRLYLLRD